MAGAVAVSSRRCRALGAGRPGGTFSAVEATPPCCGTARPLRSEHWSPMPGSNRVGRSVGEVAASAACDGGATAPRRDAALASSGSTPDQSNALPSAVGVRYCSAKRSISLWRLRAAPARRLARMRCSAWRPRARNIVALTRPFVMASRRAAKATCLCPNCAIRSGPITSSGL